MQRENFQIMSYENDASKRMMERDGPWGMSTMNSSTNRLINSPYTNVPSLNCGELTGEPFNISKFETGMPMRNLSPPSNRSPESRQNDHSTPNPKLDFDLYNATPTTRVAHWDPGSMSNSFGSNISAHSPDSNSSSFESTLTPSQPNRMDFTSLHHHINQFGTRFLNLFSASMKTTKSCFVSPYHIIKLLWLIELGSTTHTQSSVTGQWDRSIQTQHITSLHKILRHTGAYTQNDAIGVPHSFMEFNDMTVRSQFNDSFIVYRTQTQSNEITKESDHLNQQLGTRVIKSNMLDNSSILVINKTTVKFYPNIPFNPKLKRMGTFYGLTQRDVPMLSQISVPGLYFENENVQVLELINHTKQLALGIILPKKNYFKPSTEILNSIQSQLKPQILNQVTLPHINQKNNYQIDSFIKRMGFGSMFKKLNWERFMISNYGSKPIKIGHWIHWSSFELMDQPHESTPIANPSATTSNINFIANHQFIYYVKLIKPELILSVGQYY